jgi:O-antigen ligase
MTQTRGAWLGLTAGVSFLLWVRKKYLLLVFPVVAVAIFLAAPPSIKSRIGSFLDPTDLTFNERLFMWHSGLQLIREHPWTGVGMDGLKRVYPAYKYPGALKEHTGHLHNNLLQIGAERGLIGLAFWLWIWVSYVRQAWGVAASLPPQATGARALVLGSLASVASFQVAGLSEYTFGDSEVVMLVYFLMALPFLIQKHSATRCAKV